MPMQANPPEQNQSKLRVVLKWLILGLKFIAICTLLADFILYIITIKAAIKSDTFNDYEKAFQLLSAVGFMAMLIMQGLGEIGPKWYLKRVTFLRVMGVRGLLLGWQGIQAIDNVTSDAGKVVTDISPATLKVFGDITGWTMIGVGLIFCLLSVFRVKAALNLYEEEAGYTAAEDKSKQNFSDIDKERQKAAQPGGGKQLLSPEARTVISNMAIALDITSSKAWDMFNGPAGAEEARRIRNERAQALASNNYSASAGEPRDYTERRQSVHQSAPPPPPGQLSPPEYSPSPAGGRSARLLAQDDDALAAQYYGTTGR